MRGRVIIDADARIGKTMTAAKIDHEPAQNLGVRQTHAPVFLGGAVLLYLLGAALAWTQGITIDWARLLLGQLLVTSIQLTTHYANEYYDYDVDAAIGSARTPFSGGSGILVSGQLDRAVALHATQVCLVLALILIVVCGSLSSLMWIVGLLGLLGGYFYSAPPLKLEGERLGRVNTAILTAVLVPLTGYVMQTNHFDPIVLIVCAPFVLIYIAMILTFEFPDYPADKAMGKRNYHCADRLAARGVAAQRIVDRRSGVNVRHCARQSAVVARRAAGRVADCRRRVACQARSGWQRPALLSGGAVLLAGLVPALWLIELPSVENRYTEFNIPHLYRGNRDERTDCASSTTIAVARGRASSRWRSSASSTGSCRTC